jgi:plasmid stabilization system protein ParE
MRLIYHPQAEVELIAAARFYESRSPGLGSRFLAEVDAAVMQILANPTMWGIVEGNSRRRILNRFPFAIYYRIEDDELWILVVKHHSRHPDYGRSRMR